MFYSKGIKCFDIVTLPSGNFKLILMFIIIESKKDKQKYKCSDNMRTTVEVDNETPDPLVEIM